METKKPVSKKYSTAVCIIAYIVAGVAAYITGYLLSGYHAIVVVAGADVVATVVVFLFSVIFDNSSIYDPYWSVAPFYIALYWAVEQNSFNLWDPRSVIVLVLVGIWGVRLTANWYMNWPGLHHEDWRYVDFRKTTGKLYWLVSFSGIHLFPTVMVFLGCLSLYPVLNGNLQPFGLLDIIALIVTGGAILIEMIADIQLHRFIDSKPAPGTVMDKGLWAYSRHPNYFGEVSFWWGLFLFSCAVTGFTWWTLIGPVAITVMFLTASIPMMDRRSIERRPAYAEYMSRVSGLIPWFARKK